MIEIFSLPVIVGILTSAIRLATPYLYASIGEAFAQTSGVVNLGVDGIMLVGAFAAFYVTLNTGNLWLGLLAAMIVGLLMGLLMSLDQRHTQSRTGHQRYRPVHVRAGAISSAVQSAGWHGQNSRWVFSRYESRFG